MGLIVKVKQPILAPNQKNNKKKIQKNFNYKFVGLLGVISIIFIASAVWLLIDPTPTAETISLKTSEINFIVKEEALIATSKNAFANYNTDTLGKIINNGEKLFQGLKIRL
jgi:hypothetical protein